MSSRKRAEEVFYEVMDKPPGDRAVFLRSLCGTDATLRAEVEALLAADADSKSVPRPASAPIEASRAETVATPKTIGEEPGDVVGSYKLLQKLGEGGFGTVWVAEQRAPVRRKVALKILKAGLDTGDVLARFEAERQALAMMDHPHVAKVYDAGATDVGRPYFVMEHVPGLSITEYCDTGKLRIRQRLELLIPICQAVQHAHQKGIIHRDLKPGNIMVTLHDGKPVPKVIDFGIAKATIGHLTDRTLYTVTGRMMGTPEYMSPEQAGTSGLDVDTRTDVYSLGVILYELLTGTLPFDPKTLRSAGLDGMAKIIKEMEPPRPSTRLGTLATEAVNRKTGETPEEIGKRHGMAFSELRRELHGDLDWIVMKCLEKDRARRYETPNSLALDIQRHLDGEPVVAAPPSAAYKLRKFVRRHKVGVLAGVGIAAALVLGVIGTTVGMVRAMHAEREQSALRAQAEAARDAATVAEATAKEQADAAQVARAEAEVEAANAKAVTDFLRRMLNSVNPSPDPDLAIPAAADSGSPGRMTALDAFVEERSSTQEVTVEVTVLEMLQRSLPTIEQATKDRPAVEAAVREIIGRTISDMGFPTGFPQMEKAILAYKAAYGTEDPRTLEAQVRLAEATGNPYLREPMLVPLIPVLERVLGPEDRWTLGAKVLLTGAICDLRETCRHAVDELEQLVAALDRLNPPSRLFRPKALRFLSVAYANRGDTAQGVTVARRALELAQATFGPDHRETINAARNLSDRLADADRLEEALTITEEVYKNRVRVIGHLSSYTLWVAWKRVELLFRLGRAEEAVAAAEKDFAELEAQGYANKKMTLQWRSNGAAIFTKYGEVQRACDILADVLRRAYTQRFAGFAGTWDVVTNIEWRLDQKTGEAWSECLVEDAVALAEQATREFPEDRLERYRLVELAGQVLSRRKECERAVPLAKEAYEGIIRIIGNKDDRAENAFSRLAIVFGRCGDAGDVVYLSSLLERLAVELADDPDQLLERFGSTYWDTRRSPHFHVLGLECARRAHQLAPKCKEEAAKFYSTDGLAWLLHLNGRTAEAEPMMRDMIEQFERTLPSHRSDILQSRGRFAEILAAAGKTQEAKGILVPACDELFEIFRRDDEDMDTWVKLLIELHEADGEHDQAESWRAKLAAGPKKN